MHRALDRELGTPVALKILRRLDGGALLRFKRELRELRDIHHENLAELHELYEDDGLWFFTMELVPGTDLLEHVGRRDIVDGWVCDEMLLRSCIRQLAQGLQVVHDHGLVHRDVKPSNVRVTPGGRLVLLDFGAVSVHRDTTQALGTPAYMAPEQAFQGPVLPSADWYAVGVVIYEALTGRLPAGRMTDGFPNPAHRPPTPPSSLAPCAPDLEQLCLALLAADPDARPSGAEVLARLEVEVRTAVAPTTSSVSEPPFVGRQSALACLEEALGAVTAGGFAAVYLEGDSGMGKSALVRELLRRVRQSDTLVLSGQCHHRESVSYNALDGAVDRLADFLRRVPEERCAALLPTRAAWLPELFPVLASVRPIALATTRAHPPESPETRRLVLFEAVRDLLGRLAEQRCVIVVLDDLQWADRESLALLDEILRPPLAPPLLLIGILRSGSETSAEVRGSMVRWTEAAAHHAQLSVEALSDGEAKELAEKLCGDTARGHTIAAEAQGHPLLIELLVRHSASNPRPTLEDAVVRGVSLLSDATRACLEVVCLAGVGLPPRVVALAANLPQERQAEVLRELRRARWVRLRRTVTGEVVEPYHDRIRVAVEKGCTPRHAELHRCLVTALLAAGSSDHESLARHWEGAGDVGRAAESAARAADQSARALAFNKAARLYARALRMNPHSATDVSVRLRYADALERSGQCEATAHQLGLVLEAGVQDPRHKTQLQSRRVQNLVRGGRIEEGLREARALCRRLGVAMPASARTGFARLAWLMARRTLRGEKFEERAATSLDPDALLRADVLFDLASSLGAVAQPHGVVLQMEAALAALELGEPGRIATAVAFDAIGMTFRGALDKVDDTLERARELGERSHDQGALGMCRVGEGLGLLMSAQYGRALEPLRQAEALMRAEATTTGWKLHSALALRLMCLREAGCDQEHLLLAPAVLREALAQDDAYRRCQSYLYGGWHYYLQRDDPVRALAALDTADGLVERPDFQSECWYSEHARLVSSRYAEHEATGRQRLLERWPEISASVVMRAHYMGVYAHLLNGLCALDEARHAREVSAVLQKRAHSSLKWLRRKHRGAHALLAAAHTAHERDPRAAVAELLEAAKLLDAGHWGGLARAARHRARLLGGDGQAEDAAGDQAAMQTAGVVDPGRLLCAQLPGFDGLGAAG